MSLEAKRKFIEAYILAGICVYNGTPWQHLFLEVSRTTTGTIARQAKEWSTRKDKDLRLSLDRFFDDNNNL